MAGSRYAGCIQVYPTGGMHKVPWVASRNERVIHVGLYRTTDGEMKRMVDGGCGRSLMLDHDG